MYELNNLLNDFFYFFRIHPIILIILAIILAIIFYFITLYNQLIFLKNTIQKNWSNIGVLLKQRNTQLEKLVDSCVKYMDYEADTLTKIVKLRESLTTACDNKDVNTINTAETEIRSSIKHLFALAENYPNLKSDTVFNNLQQSIIEIESSISDRREFYNDSVNSSNIAIQEFPSNILANIFNFKKHELLVFEDKEIQDVNIKNLFKKSKE